jgi:hypothetical protein
MMAGIAETMNSGKVSVFSAMAPPPGLAASVSLSLTVVRLI